MKKDTEKPYRGQGRVAFLDGLETFRALVDKGYPLKVIYDGHKDTLHIGYEQFTKYVGMYIGGSKDAGHQKREKAAQHTRTETKQDVKTGTGGFRHDPAAGSTRDDLV